MQALAEILRAIRLDSAIFFHAEFGEPWCLASPPSAELARQLSRAGGHVIVYHLLCEGRAWVQPVGGARVDLTAGDLVTFPHGDGHHLGGTGHAAPVDARSAMPGVLAHGVERLRLGGTGATARFICGFLACDPQVSRAFLGGLPPLIRVHIRADASGQWLERSLEFFVNQAASREPGAGEMLTRLSEVALAETLRRYAWALPDEATGWLAGARDADVGRALGLIHQRPAEPWSVAALSREAGVSRTVLTERFTHFLGVSPMAYLRDWRLRLAARSLASSDRSVAQIATDAGYGSEAAFNRAFKRAHGIPPAAYRRREAEPPAPPVASS